MKVKEMIEKSSEYNLYEVSYQLGNQKGIGYFSNNEIDYLKKNTNIEIISIKRG